MEHITKRGQEREWKTKRGVNEPQLCAFSLLDGGVSVIDHFCSASRPLKRSQETKNEAA